MIEKNKLTIPDYEPLDAEREALIRNMPSYSERALLCEIDRLRTQLANWESVHRQMVELHAEKPKTPYLAALEEHHR